MLGNYVRKILSEKLDVVVFIEDFDIRMIIGIN